MASQSGSGLNGESLEQLYLEHERNLYNIARRYVRDAHEAQDVVQEVFVNLWRRRQQIRVDTVTAYLYRATFNLCANKYRWKKLRQFLPFGEDDGDDDSDPANLLSREQESVQLEQALRRLPHRLRQVLILSDVLGHSYAEIATILQIPAGTVGSRRNKALQIMKQCCEAKYGGFDV